MTISKADKQPINRDCHWLGIRTELPGRISWAQWKHFILIEMVVSRLSLSKLTWLCKPLCKFTLTHILNVKSIKAIECDKYMPILGRLKQNRELQASLG